MPRPTPEERAAEAARLASISWAEAERQRIRAHPRKTKVITRAQAKAVGLCVLCKSRDAAPGYAQCAGCKEKNRVRSQHYRERNISQGMCAKCGRRPFRPGYMLCDECQGKASADPGRRGDPGYSAMCRWRFCRPLTRTIRYWHRGATNCWR